MSHKYDRTIEPWAIWTQGGLFNGPNNPWVLGHLKAMRYFWDWVSLYLSLTKSGFYLKWKG